MENAIKAVLLSRVRRTGEKDGGFIISSEGAYHGRMLGSLAVMHRKRVRLGFPTFDWPQAPWPSLDLDDGLTRTREERSLRRSSMMAIAHSVRSKTASKARPPSSPPGLRPRRP